MTGELATIGYENETQGEVIGKLKNAGVPCLHYYTMGNAETTTRIAAKVF